MLRKKRTTISNRKCRKRRNALPVFIPGTKEKDKVENMNADVLLLAVKNDDCWPSDVAVPRMLKVFEKNDYPHRIESYIYEKGSHALTDCFSEMSGFTKLLVKTMIPTEKKYPKECEEARYDSCARIIKFIEEW